MKKFTFRTLLAVAAASVLLTACKDENDDGNTSKTTYEFSVKAEDNPIDVPADGKTYTSLVTSTKMAQAGTSAVAYEVVSSPEWAPAELEQTALVITVAKNSSTEAREPGKVVLKQDESDKTLEITVNQAGFSNSMSLEAAYSTDRCKVLLIEPAITGFDQNPVYEWTVKGPGDAEAAEAGTDKTLSFIELETGDYTISLTVTDDSGITETKSATVTVTTEATAYSPCISEVFEYRPALLNDKGLRFGPNDTYTSALQSVSQGLSGKEYSELNQGVNLGSFGGFIVFGFDHTVMNVKGLRDFRIGSPLSKTGYPGQGVVYVSFDANNNGKADDEWYEIAGSEYGKTGERRDLKIVYTRPADLAPTEATEGWAAYAINESETGAYCYAKAMWGTVVSYWPEWLKESAEGAALTYTGCTMLPPLAKAPEDPSGWPTATTRWYDYGYACNSDPKDETGSSFDIDWARDKDGNKVNLPGVDFVKVQNATLQDLGFGYGPSCVQINCAIDLHLKGTEIETIAQ